MNCYECRQPGADVLSVHVHEAQPGAMARWRTVHGQCHDDCGYSYGVDFADIASRGLEFWINHIGGKTWVRDTDYAIALTRVAAAVRAAREKRTSNTGDGEGTA